MRGTITTPDLFAQFPDQAEHARTEAARQLFARQQATHGSEEQFAVECPVGGAYRVTHREHAPTATVDDQWRGDRLRVRRVVVRLSLHDFREVGDVDRKRTPANCLGRLVGQKVQARDERVGRHHQIMA